LRDWGETEKTHMPVVTLTDITLRSLRPTPGKQVTYIDKSLKGFGVRVNERGMSYVLTYRESARETASAASDAGMNSLSGRLENGANPKSR